MAMLTFRHATAQDKQNVIDFLDANWGEKHPLVHLPDFFTHYYCYENTLQFCFAEEDGVPIALAGYIRANASDTPDIWVSIWCAVKGKNGAGLELMAALSQLTGARSMACNNIRPKTMAFYTFLGYHAARLPHYYRLAAKSEYAVAQITDGTILPVGGDAVLTKLTSADALAHYTSDLSARPCKDAWYLKRRYFNYPRQTYDVYGVYVGDSIESLLVTRTVPVNGTAVLRIVDYIGKPQTFAALGNAIDKLLAQNGAEYVDCYCFGISPEVFAAAGFCERTAECPNILPNYLTPPLYENTEYYFFTDTTEHFTIFKADGDQDRPNILLEE